MEMIIATWMSQAITVAAELGVADALADRPMTIDELAAAVGADADALGRLLRALIGRGVFRRRRDGRYELNSLARHAVFGRTGVDGWAAQFYGSREQRERWTLLVDSIRTGKSVVPVLHGKESFDYFAEDPEHADLFNRTMASISELTDASVAAGYDFSAYPTIVDVGGGHGALLATILAATPRLARRPVRPSRQVVANASRTAVQAPCGRSGADRGGIVLRQGSGRRRRVCAEKHHARLARREGGADPA